MKIIYDTLWGDIRTTDLAISIVDTPMYQRMANIKQTSMAYRVFPTATHTRLNHQIGVYGLGHKLLDNLIRQGHLVLGGDRPLTPTEMTEIMATGDKPRITEDEYEWICLGGLIHDLGHGPASHTFDDLIEDLMKQDGLITNTDWTTHEQRSQELFRYMVVTEDIKISNEGIDYICNIINPPRTHHHDFRFQFVNNEVNGVDIDKMDYIARDCLVFGLGSDVSVERIITNSSIVVGYVDDTKGSFGTYWSFSDRIKNDVFNLFMMRHQLYRDIYNHPKIVKFELAYKNVLKNSLKELVKCFNERDCKAFISMTDESMLWRADEKLRDEFVARDTIQMVENGSVDSPIVVETTVGFFGKCGFNPFHHIRFHSRNTHKVKNIELSDINMFLCFDCTCEIVHYEYVYTPIK